LGLFQPQPVAATPPPQPKPEEAPVTATVPEPEPTVATEPTPTNLLPPPTTTPVLAETPAEPEPPPPPLPELRNVVSAFRIAGARANSTGGMVMIGTTPYQPGETVDPINNLTFVGFTDGVMIFRDERGALYTRRF
jgi:hypothetical protein